MQRQGILKNRKNVLKLTKTIYMSVKNDSELKNPIFWCLIAVLTGIGLGVWGMIKGDCIGTNCWVGSGFLKWTGGILAAAGLVGWQILGNRKRN
jgi:hypothetical protein